jgi:hypothetical protein
MVYAFHVDTQPYVSQLIGFLFSPDFQRFDQRAQTELVSTLAGLTGSGPIIGPPADLVIRHGDVVSFDPHVGAPIVSVGTSGSSVRVRVDPEHADRLLLSGYTPGRTDLTVESADVRREFTIDVTP